MRILCTSLFSLTILGISVPSETVTCYADYYYRANNDNSTCEGDFCLIIKSNIVGLNEIIRSCIAGAKKPSSTCSLSFADEMVCYCDTDFCNTPDLFRSNFSLLPIIECKSVRLQTYIATACNKCIRRIEYRKDENTDPSKLTKEFAEGDGRIASAEFVLDYRGFMTTRIYNNFFSNACYNISMNPNEYSVYCRCTQNNCNTPEVAALPYPISEPAVTCHVSGFGSIYNPEKYGTSLKHLENQSYVDEGIDCRGHFCFIAAAEYMDEVSYYKGCISANEQGENRIQLGYSYLNFVSFHICDTDFCNSDIETAVEEARNASLTVRDNGADFSFNIFLSLLAMLSSCLIS